MSVPYLAAFGLREEPFRLTPDPRCLYPGGQYQRALAELAFGVSARKGFMVLTGEVGTGKTTLCRALLDRLGPGVKTALVLNPGLSAEELIRAVVADFGIPGADASQSKAALIERLNGFLLRVALDGGNALLVVDEAQRLAPEVLEELRLLGNLETEREKLLNILLVGQPELSRLLARDDLRQLRQRVAVRTDLGRLSSRETAAYVRHRLAVAAGGGTRELFTPAALSRAARAARGIPRTFNLVCDRALLAAYAAGEAVVTHRLAARAAREVLRGTGSPGRLPGWRTAWRRGALASAIALAAVLPFALPAVLSGWGGEATGIAQANRCAPVLSRYLAGEGLAGLADEAVRWNLPLSRVDELARALGALNLAGRYGVEAVRLPWDREMWREARMAGVVALAAGGFAILAPGEGDGWRITDARGGETRLTDAELAEWLALEEALMLYRSEGAGARSLMPGAQGIEVAALQQGLAAAGFPPAGGSDGSFGSSTVRSLQEFQRRWRLPASGVLDDRTRFLLARLGKGGVG
jgi:type II secretory pathway predicted ATPase ExeA